MSRWLWHAARCGTCNAALGPFRRRKLWRRVAEHRRLTGHLMPAYNMSTAPSREQAIANLPPLWWARPHELGQRGAR